MTSSFMRSIYVLKTCIEKASFLFIYVHTCTKKPIFESISPTICTRNSVFMCMKKRHAQRTGISPKGRNHKRFSGVPAW